MRPRRLVVGLTGASGVIYGIRLLQALRTVNDVSTHLVMTPAARQTIALETDWEPKDVERLADETYPIGQVAAAISSGSFATVGMAVVPCSMRTLSGIAYSLSDNLLQRAADVVLKERRRLVLMTRETPLHLGHLRAMVQVTEMGAVVMPAMPSFYNRPQSLADVVDQSVNRLLDMFDIELPEDLFDRWEGPNPKASSDGHRSSSRPDGLGVTAFDRSLNRT